MRTHVVDHPLVAHKLTVLRDQHTDSPTFRRLADELVTLLAYEATREVRVEPDEITTPVASMTGTKLATPKPLVVPILRAGLGMLDGMMRLLPTGILGLVFAALIAAIIASTASKINSIATIFTLDIWAKFKHQRSIAEDGDVAQDRKLVVVHAR